MDPITLATITSAVTVLALEAGKGMASEAGKSAWQKIKKLFGMTGEPKEEDLAREVAERLVNDPALAKEVLSLLENRGTGSSSALVNKIDAEKVVVVDHLEVRGDFNM